MSFVIYKIGTTAYFIAIRIASLWNKKAQKWIKGRKNWEEQTRLKVPKKKSKRYWIHCASLGEFEQARPLIDHLKKEEECSIVVSFFSPSGYEIRKEYNRADAVLYLPSDSKRNAKKFLDLVDPDVVYFIKYEFWASYIFETQKRNLPLFGISIILRPDQIYFKSYGGYFKKILKAFDHLYIQNEETGELLKSIGINTYNVSGDTRYNRVFEIARSSTENETIANFKGSHKLLIMGSIWKEDMEILSGFLNRELPDHYKALIAPHNIDKESINKITKYLKQEEIALYNEFTTDNQSNKFLILNTMGNLASAYRYGNLAYVGGGFKTGLHNTLEPASHGLPVIFGPDFKKFDEANLLIKNGFAVSIKNPEEFHAAFWKFEKNDQLNVKEFIHEQQVDLYAIKRNR